MSAAVDIPEEDEVRAAELALGLIEGEERRAAERQLGSDAAFGAAYDRWLSYAAGLFDGPGEAPPASVWGAIETRLPANDTASPSRGSVRWWQAGTGIASAAAILLAVVAVRQPAPAPVSQPAPIAAPQPAPPQPVAPLVAVLTGKTGVVAVSYDPQTGRITSAPNGVAIGKHSPELWVIPADGKPRSLGVIGANDPGWTKAPGAASAAMAPGVTLAISVEPIGGSPTGQPTGAVILTGKLAPA